MHLAIKASETLESARPVRALIYYGSPIDIKDNQDNIAIDVAEKLEESKVKDEILKYLNHRVGLVEFL